MSNMWRRPERKGQDKEQHVVDDGSFLSPSAIRRDLTRQVDLHNALRSEFDILEATYNAHIAGHAELVQDTVGNNLVLNNSQHTWTYNDTNGTLTVGHPLGSISNLFLASMSGSTVKGRVAGGGGDPQDLTMAQLIALLAADGIFAGTIRNQVESANVLMDDGFYISVDEVRARDSGGLVLADDAGTVGLFIEDSTADVGVGHNAPAEKLHAIGNIRADGATAYLELRSTDTTGRIWRILARNDASSNVFAIRDATAGADRFTLDTGGKMMLAGSLGNWSVDGTGAVQEFTRAGGNYLNASSASGYFNIITGGNTANDANATLRLLANRDVLIPNGNVGIADTSPDGKLDVVQASTTAAVPTLELEQADLSEEFINFVATAGAGNPIDTAALGVYGGKIRVGINGVFRYIPYYNT